MDQQPPEDLSPYSGDHPNGTYWSAHPVAGAARSNGRSPWARTSPRTPDEPYPLRMFAEESCASALWGVSGEPPPGIGDDVDYRLLEDVLPISADLRQRLIEWARQNTLSRSDDTAAELDWKGFDLSRELATTLGELYSVEYSPTCAGPHRADLRQRASGEPVTGWSLHLSPSEG